MAKTPIDYTQFQAAGTSRPANTVVAEQIIADGKNSTGVSGIANREDYTTVANLNTALLAKGYAQDALDLMTPNDKVFALRQANGLVR